MEATWALAALAALALAAAQGSSSDRIAIEEAATGHANAVHKGDPALVKQHVSREFVGIWYEQLNEADWGGIPLRYDILHSAAMRARENDEDRLSGPDSVEILDLQSNTALVKTEYGDRLSYLQVCKKGEHWRARFELMQSPVVVENSTDPAKARAAIEQSVQDYVEGYYQADSERLSRSLQVAVLRLGYWREDSSKPWHVKLQDPEALREDASKWNEGKSLLSDAPRDIEVIEMSEQIAAVRLNAQWGKETLLLALHYDGTWRIHFATWESE